MKNSKNSTVGKASKINRGLILKAIPGSYGIVSDIAKRAKIDRKTVYNWINKDDKLAELFISERENLLDLAEIKLVEKIKTGSESMIALVLKTLGKSRGYVEGKAYDPALEDKLQNLKNLFDSIN